jgi:hypothetical protein
MIVVVESERRAIYSRKVCIEEGIVSEAAQKESETLVHY